MLGLKQWFVLTIVDGVAEKVEVEANMSKSRLQHSRRLPIGFLFVAGLLFAFWTLLLFSFVLHRTYINGQAVNNSSRLESVWAWLMMAALGWALANLYWSAQSVKLHSEKGVLGHFAIAIGCGLIGLGMQSVMVARSLTQQPLVLDYSYSSESALVPQPSAAVATAGNAAEGRKVFSTTCITCHGPTGQGMPNLAPSLVGSQFIGSANDAAVANVIRSGRPLGDPNNKSGKVMPARGGNPFLTEEQVLHLAAFVRAIQSGGAVSTDASKLTVQLARWVVPAATQPPNGIDKGRANSEINAGLSRIEQHAKRREVLLRGLTIGLIGVHGLFLLGVVAFSSSLILPRLLTGQPLVDRWAGKLAVNGWIMASVSWLLIAWFCFWWS